MLKLPSLHFSFAQIKFENNLCGVPVFSVCRFLKYYGQFCRQSSYWTSLAAHDTAWLSSFTWKEAQSPSSFYCKILKVKEIHFYPFLFLFLSVCN